MPFGLQILTQNGMASTEDVQMMRKIGSRNIQLNWNGDSSRGFDVDLDWTGVAAGRVVISASCYRSDTDEIIPFTIVGDNIINAGSPRPSTIRVATYSYFEQNLNVVAEIIVMEI